ncbi:MAG: hypothetical protein WBE26_11900 [Phycisphaerae bacterium]
MTAPHVPSSYRELVQQTPAPSDPPTRNPEEELDSLLSALDGRREQTADRNAGFSADPIQRLRELTLSELVPVFVELVEKYSQSGISLQMDASNFLQGGREIKFEFGIGGWRSHLQGTVTADAIAFHEARFTPDVHGELLSGPMLRVRGLNADTFRNFVCERLTVLLRSVMRRR